MPIRQPSASFSLQLSVLGLLRIGPLPYPTRLYPCQSVATGAIYPSARVTRASSRSFIIVVLGGTEKPVDYRRTPGLKATATNQRALSCYHVTRGGARGAAFKLFIYWNNLFLLEAVWWATLVCQHGFSALPAFAFHIMFEC